MREIGVKEITKLAEGHIANKPKNQDQRPLRSSSYKTKQQQQLTANKSTCLCVFTTFKYFMHINLFTLMR